LRFFFSIAARYKSRAAFLLFYTAFGTSKRPKSANPSSSQKTKNRMSTGFSSIHAVFQVAPAGVEPAMGESKSPALPLGDGASVENSIAYFSNFHKSRRAVPPKFSEPGRQIPSLPGSHRYDILSL
jgi:hypothetical protein